MKSARAGGRGGIDHGTLRGILAYDSGMSHPARSLPTVLFLILGTPFIIESCLTAATLPARWLEPGTALLLIFAYGPPILWIREAWARRRLGLASLLALGLVYGILNEGILAHTLTQTAGEPLASFLGYDEWLGVHWAWALFILPWHSVYSVVFMVLLTRLWFPARAEGPWLSDRMFRITGGIALLGLPLYFVFKSGQRPAPGHVFFILLGAAGILLSLGLRKSAAKAPACRPRRSRLVRASLSGLFLPSLVTIAAFEAARNRLPLGLHIAGSLAVMTALFTASRRVHERIWLAFFSAGAIGLCAFAVILSRDPVQTLLAPVFIGFMLLSLVRIFREGDRGGTADRSSGAATLK